METTGHLSTQPAVPKEEASTPLATSAILHEDWTVVILGFLIIGITLFGFVLIAASLLFSFLISPDTTATVKDSLKNLQGLWFALAFTSIGLENKLCRLVPAKQQKAFIRFSDCAIIQYCDHTCSSFSFILIKTCLFNSIIFLYQHAIPNI